MTKDHEFKSESESIWSPAYSKMGIPLHKIQITNNTNDKKNFRYHITINYAKSSSAYIDLSHVVAKNVWIIIKWCARVIDWES